MQNELGRYIQFLSLGTGGGGGGGGLGHLNQGIYNLSTQNSLFSLTVVFSHFPCAVGTLTETKYV